MARSDLLLNLVRARAAGDDRLFQQTVEAIISEERSKQHHVLANQLAAELMETPKSSKSQSISSSSRVQNLLFEVVPHKRLDDLVLSPDALNTCVELIEEQQRADLLRSYNLEPRSRILLSGPPGNGKTSLAEAIAEALSLNLLSVRYDGLITSYLGETNQRLKQIFEYARQTPCVLFFDEFDTVSKERGDEHETGEIKRVVSSLLLQIDSLPSHVIVIAASNHPELLDRAVWRRFQVKLKLELPTLKEIESWLTKFEHRTGIKLSPKINALAISLSGLSFSDIENFSNNILRRYILEKPSADISSIVRRQLAGLTTDRKVKPKHAPK